VTKVELDPAYGPPPEPEHSVVSFEILHDCDEEYPFYMKISIDLRMRHADGSSVPVKHSWFERTLGDGNDEGTHQGKRVNKQDAIFTMEGDLHLLGAEITSVEECALVCGDDGDVTK
jgi:hypothetical protein